MKKILLMLTMVLVLGFSAICSASNGKVLDAEEAMVNKFLAASNYSAVTSMMTDGMKKDFTEEVFKNFKEQMDKNFGAVSEKRLVVIEKGADADILRYSMKFAKQPEAMMSFLFAVKNEKPLLGDFGIALPQKEENKEVNIWKPWFSHRFCRVVLAGAAGTQYCGCQCSQGRIVPDIGDHDACGNGSI